MSISEIFIFVMCLYMAYCTIGKICDTIVEVARVKYIKPDFFESFKKAFGKPEEED